MLESLLVRSIVGQAHREWILRTVVQRAPEAEVLAWGLAGTSSWLAGRMAEAGGGGRITCIEHAAEAASAAAESTRGGGNVEVLLRRPAGPAPQVGSLAAEDPAGLEEYLNAVDGRRFDVVIVDGLARNACLQKAVGLLKPGGVVFLHDAQRAWYDQGKQGLFDHGHMGGCPDYPGPQLWWGGVQPPSPLVEPKEGELPLIVSFYTRGTIYEEAAARLRASCEALGLEHEIVAMADSGSWELNRSFKPRFLRQMLDKHGRAVLWVDADAEIRRPPELLRGPSQGAADFAAHRCEGWQIAGGTVLVGSTPLGQKLLDAWIRRAQADPAQWDQVHLDLAWEEITVDYPLRTLWLPQAYARIFDRPAEDPTADDPVVLHYQASRKAWAEAAERAGSTGSREFRPRPVISEDHKQARRASRPRAGFYDARYSPRPRDLRPNGLADPAAEGLEAMLATSALNWRGIWSDPDLAADRLLAICGGGRVLHIGCGGGEFVSALLRRGVDAFGMDVEVPAAAAAAVDGRLSAGVPEEYSGADGSFDTVIVSRLLDGREEPAAASILAAAHRLSRRTVVLVLDVSQERLAGRDRQWWERAALGSGFRKHPACQLLVPYEALEGDGTGLWGSHLVIALEKVPAAAAGDFPLESLQAEQGLHNDMLRVAGRRADAHVARYVLAARYIRPGDTVLDVACGLGYGAAVLAECSRARQIIGVDDSEFAVRYAAANYGDGVPHGQGPPGRGTQFVQADAARLAFLQDSSVDAVVSMETLEHLPDPEAFLREAQRVLRPGGRIIVSVPNDWTDQSGRDPNPHHLHVYTWAKIREQIAAAFLPEAAFAQVAGGGMKLADRPRRLREVPVNASAAPEDVEAEWWLLVGMKDPVGSTREGFVETVYGEDGGAKGQAGNVVAFERDYDNPWLVRSIVSIGMRAGGELLEQIAAAALRRARAGSADAGAALCVLIYRELERSPLDRRRVDELLEQIAAYHKNADDTPHAWRWRISIQYAAGLLLLRTGRRTEARAAFEQCAAMDCTRFSPLLATKTVDACFQAGRIAACDGDHGSARALWRQGVAEVKRCLSVPDWANTWGEDHRPLPFALPELEQVMDLGWRCAAGLRALDEWPARPGRVWELMHANRAQEMAELWREARRLAGEWEAQNARARGSGESSAKLWDELQSTARQRDVAQHHAGQLQQQLDQAYAEQRRLAAEWEEQVRRSRELSGKVEGLWAEAQQYRQEAQRLAGEWQAQVNRAAAVESALADTTRERDAMRAEAMRLAGEWETVAAELRSKRGELEEVRSRHDMLETQTARLREELRAAEAHNAALKAHLTRLEEAIARHESRAVTIVLRRAGLLQPIEARNGRK